MSVRDRSQGSAKLAVAAIVAIVFAVGGTGVWFLDNGNPAARPTADAPRYEVRRGDLRIILSVTGTFTAEESVPVIARIRGSARIVWLVDEGTEVKKEQVLVELDKTDVENQIEQLEGQVVTAEANLVAAQADQEITRLESESKILDAQLAVEMAALEIKKFNEGAKPKEARDAQIKIGQAKVKLIRAKAVDARMPDMLKQGFVTKEEVEQSRLDVQTAENEQGTTLLEDEILTKYTHPMQLKKLLGEKRRAEAELARYEQEARRRKARATATTSQREQELRRAQDQLKDAKERLANMTIRAEGDGIVVYGSGYGHWRYEPEPLKVGSTAHQNQVLMRLPNLNTMQVLVEVHEADIKKVRADPKNPQPAIVMTDAMPDKRFDGYVKKVETLAQSRWYKQSVKFFLTTIGLKKQITDVRPGTTATVEIFIAGRSNVLYVPVQYVQTLRGKNYCYVGDDGERRRVVVGASNNTFIEIKEGLEEGEEVVLIKPEASSDDGTPEEGVSPAAANGRGARGDRKGAR